MSRVLFGILILAATLPAQETAVKSTNIYIDDSGNNVAGSLEQGVTIQKLRKTKDGKFVKATLEFYIPIESLENPDVYANIGTKQRSGSTVFTLQKVEIKGKKATVYLDISNEGKSKLKFTAAVLTKLVSSGDQNGDLNPFEGRNQGFAEIPPQKSASAILVYDFKSKPEGLVFICKEKMAGEEVQYSVPN